MRRCRLTILILSLWLIGPAAVWSAVKTETLDYQDGEVELRGFIAWDDAVEGQRPAVIVVHEWWGLNDYARQRAEQLAALGYVAFAIDMYGRDRVTQHGKQAKEWKSQITSNVDAWQRRALLGVDILRRNALVDPTRIAAVGYCFGGATVMQMAYSGADLKGVVSFHGSLPAPTKEQMPKIRAKILVEHGNADSFIPKEQITRFQEALEKAGADWRMVVHGGAMHSFTNPAADSFGLPGLKYDERADQRAWRHMEMFLKDVFLVTH